MSSLDPLLVELEATDKHLRKRVLYLAAALSAVVFPATLFALGSRIGSIAIVETLALGLLVSPPFLLLEIWRLEAQGRVLRAILSAKQ